MGSKRILVFPMNLAAHFLRSLELCKRFKGENEIIFADSIKYGKFIEEAGYDTFRVENFFADEVTQAVNKFNFRWMNQVNLERVLSSQVDVIKEYRPDLVLSDAAFTLKMAAEITNTPYHSLLNAYMSKYYALTRNVSRNHPGYKYSTKLPPNLFDQISRRIERFTLTNIHTPYRKIRRLNGLNVTEFLLDEIEGDHNYLCDIPRVFPIKNHPSNYEYVGPLYYSNNAIEYEVNSFLDDHHPSLLVSMGSSGKWDNIEILSNSIFDNYKIIVSGQASKRLRGSNILCRPFINHCAVLPKIDLTICHGGNGTIYQSLGSGVPILCLPSNFEQEWNSNRLEALHFGKIIDEDIKPIDLKILVDEWIIKKDTQIFHDIKNEIGLATSKPIEIRLA
jgi:uncharacterized protein (TIGR00661 family)